MQRLEKPGEIKDGALMAEPAVAPALLKLVLRGP
jgi:hypothetical protein